MNLEIDILKFIFSLCVVLYHFGKITSGHIAVEFFFIVSGYFMVKNSVNYTKRRGGVQMYLKKDIFSISPFLFAGIIISLSWNFFFNNWTIDVLKTSSLLVIGEFFHSQMFGFAMFSSTGVTWYLSAMFIAKTIIFPIVLKKNDDMPYFQFLVFSLFIYGWLCHQRGSLVEPGYWLGLTYIGTLRGLSGISLGVVCFKISEYLKNFNFNRIGSIVITFVEMTLYFLAFRYMKKFAPSYWDFYIVFALLFAVAITFSEVGLLSVINRYKNSFFRKASVCIFLSHFYIVQYFPKNYPNFGTWKRRILIILQLIICSTLNYLIGIFLKKYVPLLISKLRNESDCLSRM